jgi:phosphoserine phosphatase
MRPERLDVFDFDGTLIKVNSFKEISKKLIFRLIKRFRIVPLFILILWVFLRKCRIISHFTFKKHIVNIFEKSLTEYEKRDICQRVFDENVIESVYKRMVDSDNCVICTASPFSYVSRISFLKDVPVIASLDYMAQLSDLTNFGPSKVENLNAYFHGKNIRVINFFTDAENDDQALINFSVNAFVVKDNKIIKVK